MIMAIFTVFAKFLFFNAKRLLTYKVNFNSTLITMSVADVALYYTKYGSVPHYINKLLSHADCGNRSLSDGCKAEGGNFLQPGENMVFHKAAAGRIRAQMQCLMW